MLLRIEKDKGISNFIPVTLTYKHAYTSEWPIENNFIFSYVNNTTIYSVMCGFPFQSKSENIKFY